ncbi:hypothetical protein HU200_011125 [Digitaria exilis]|uniref:Cytochrome P450 n=1 Tax=Digitaria exilis TaxID=1010633 RepID=A0A835FH73_9POAL|nr:hypothetical protein HU200_011125 [Digitaria exilis]
MAVAFFLLCMLSSLILITLFFYVVQLFKDTRSHLPPGPWPLPIIGNMLHINRNLPHRSLARLAERYGPLMSIRLGTSLFVVASSPSTARDILHRHNASLSGRSPADAWSAGGHGANSVFVLAPRRKWRLLRRLGAVHLFSPGRLEEMRPVRCHVARGLVRDVSEAASGGAAVSVRRPTFAAMVRLLWRAMFSDELGEDATQVLHDCVQEAKAVVMTPNISDVFPAVAGFDIQGVRRRMATLVGRMYRLMDQQIDLRSRARESGGGGHARGTDLLDVMLDMSEQHDGGGDVTVNRDVMRAFCTPEVEDSDIQQLPYLGAVIKETLRLHTILPILSYKAEATVQVQGYTIPEGSNVLRDARGDFVNLEDLPRRPW